MINKFVTTITNIDVYGMISISLFVIVFAGVIVWTFTRQKEFLTNMSILPLEDGEKISQSK